MRAVVGNQIVRHHAGAGNGDELDSRRIRRQALTVREGVSSKGNIGAHQFDTVVAAAGDHIVRDLCAGAECIGKANAIAVIIDQLVVRNKVVVRGTRDRNRSDRTRDGFAVVREIVLRNGIVVAGGGGAVDDDAGAGNTGRPIDEVLDAESGDGAIAGLQHKATGFSPCPRSIENDNGRSSCITSLRGGIEDDRARDRRQGGGQIDRMHTRAGDGEVDRVGPGTGVGIDNRLTQRPGAGIVRVGDSKRRQRMVPGRLRRFADND